MFCYIYQFLTFQLLNCFVSHTWSDVTVFFVGGHVMVAENEEEFLRSVYEKHSRKI